MVKYISFPLPPPILFPPRDHYHCYHRHHHRHLPNFINVVVSVLIIDYCIIFTFARNNRKREIRQSNHDYEYILCPLSVMDGTHWYVIMILL